MSALVGWLRLLLVSILVMLMSVYQASAEEDFLDPELAFSVKVEQIGQKAVAHFSVADGYYLYQERLGFQLASGSVTLGQPILPKAELKNDPNFGDVMVYKHPFDVSIPVEGRGEFELLVKYQGCALAGLCYPPQKQKTTLVADSQAVATPSASTSTNFDAEANAELSETDQIASMLSSGNVWLIIAVFFGIGLLLAFTPCVFPMIPILSSIIVGQGSGLTTRRAFVLSLVYVLAMASTYTIAGVLAGLFGANLQAAFQNPWVLSSFSVIFMVLALSMFGFFELQLPASLQAKLADVSNKQEGGTLAGVAIMGLLSALIVGPCVAPPLAGALIYIGQTGDALLGGSALFALSMGMGVPLLLVGTAAGKFMPRAGGWMDSVKAVFGVSLLAVAIWMLARILPEVVTLVLWAGLAIGSAVYLGALESAVSGWQKLWKSLGIMLLAWGVFLLIAVASGGKSALHPLAHIVSAVPTTGVSSAVTAHSGFKKVNTIAELNQALASAKAEHKAVMLDFYADWCVSCKEMEAFTFTDPVVAEQMAQLVVLQVDVTENTDDHKALMKQFGVVGPPAILFFDATSTELRHARVVGFMKAPAFAERLQKALGR
jgi:thiol:disulfide interchange protein DsbD